MAAATLAQAKTLSRQHLLVSWGEKNSDPDAAGGWFIKLMPNTRNETLLDGRVMSRDLLHALSTGEHRLEAGGFEFGLHIHAPAAATSEPAGAQSVAGLDQLRQRFGADGLFHLIADNARDLIAVLDAAGRCLWNNAAYLFCLGYRPEEVRRLHLLAEVHPGDLPPVKAAFDEALRTGTGTRVEYRMRHRDQRWVYLESQVNAVEAAGGTDKYLVLVTRDVTARKETEQKSLQRIRHLIERGTTLARLTQAPELQEGDVESCITQTVEAAVRHFECERASVWLFSPDHQELRCQDLFEHAALQHSRGGTWPVAACGQFLATLRVERCLAIDNAFTDERLNELRPIYLFSHRVSSLLAARVCLGNEVLGILVVERTDVIEHWSLEDQNFAASLADVLLAALQARKRALAFAALHKTQQLLDTELAEANKYVRALLPSPLSGEVETDWCFVPCTSLPGDGFGYRWLDDDHLIVYLLDVSGHGVGASLLCASALNMLRSSALPGVDFRDPGAVLSALNRIFDMERQSDMFFTIWYGVYDRRTRELTHAAAGHPPPVLLVPNPETKQPPHVLQGSNGTMIGVDAEALFANTTTPMPLHARLYVFSDGAFDIIQPDGQSWGFERLVNLLHNALPSEVSELQSVLQHLQEIHGSPELPDDFSILRLVFH